jgi:hypothetical protein
MEILEKIKKCSTMRELDELRYEIVEAMQNDSSNFTTIQKAFIHKGNSLKRNGHTRSSEGYSLNEVIQKHHEQEEKPC